MMKLRTISLKVKGGCPIWWFFLIVLLNLAGACNKSKKRLGQPRFSAPRSGAELPPSLPNGQHASSISTANAASPLSNVEHVPLVAHIDASAALPNPKYVPPVPNNSDSAQESQPKIIKKLGEMMQEKIKEDDTFSQKLSTITDPSERDKLLGPFAQAYNRRIDDFNLLLQKVINPNEKQRLIRDFQDTQGMCNEANSLNGQSDLADQKKYFQKYGDITEKYNGYLVESKRSQIKRRIKDLVKGKEQDTQCVICHARGSVSLLPCGDSVHLNCLTEEMIFVWRKGHSFILTCPGSCGNIIASNYFLFDDAYAKEYLTPDRLKEVFYKPKSK